MFLATEEEVCILWNMFGGIESIVFKIKILTFPLGGYRLLKVNYTRRYSERTQRRSFIN